MTDAILELYVNDGLSDEEIDQQRAVYGPLAEDVRELIQLALQTRVGAEDVARAREHLAAAREILERDREDGPYGTRFNDSGRYRNWGNAAIGLRNAIAPIGDLHQEDDGRVWADVHLGPVYEGPAGHVHGGVSALLLDQILGDAARISGHPGMTGTLTIRYRKRTPLGALRVEAELDRVEGRKAFVVGHVADAEGVCVEAEGVFIAPAWMVQQRESFEEMPSPE